MANKSKNLNLPLYTGDDNFDLEEFVAGFTSIDNMYGELSDWKVEIPKVNASAEIVQAREGKATLYDNIADIRTRINNTMYYIDIPSTGDVGALINTAINEAISAGYKKVCFPAGIHICEVPLEFKGGVIYEGTGDDTVFKQKDGVNMECVIKFTHTYPTEGNATLRNFKIDGNKEKNNVYDGNAQDKTYCIGLKVISAHYCRFQNITIENCSSDGLFMTGTVGTDWNKHNTTNFFSNIIVRYSGRYGIQLDGACNDNYFNVVNVGGGAFSGIMLSGGSNAFYQTTSFGNYDKGIYINGQQTIIGNCIFEGNGGQGLAITEYGSHSSISNTKFMANSKNTPGAMSDIYIVGSASMNVENVLITGCMFMGSNGNSDGSGYPSRAIAMESSHKGIKIANCKMDYDNNGTTQVLGALQIYGLQAGDQLDNVTYTETKLNDPDYYLYENGRLFYDMSTGFTYTPNHKLQRFLWVDKVNTKELFVSADVDGVWAEETIMELNDSLANYSQLMIVIRYGGDIEIVIDAFKYNTNTNRYINYANQYDSADTDGASYGEMGIQKVDDTHIKIINNVYRVYNVDYLATHKNESGGIKIKKIIGII